MKITSILKNCAVLSLVSLMFVPAGFAMQIRLVNGVQYRFIDPKREINLQSHPLYQFKKELIKSHRDIKDTFEGVRNRHRNNLKRQRNLSSTDDIVTKQIKFLDLYNKIYDKNDTDDKETILEKLPTLLTEIFYLVYRAGEEKTSDDMDEFAEEG